jgi:phage FluMu protein Com
METVRCGQCKTLLNELPQTPTHSRIPCPKCGSTSRLFQKTLAATAIGRVTLGLKGREAGRRKPFLKQISGASYFRKAQRWVERLLRIDRHNNQYREVVTDPETGVIIHKCEEPLSEHRGHGDARKKDV